MWCAVEGVIASGVCVCASESGVVMGCVCDVIVSGGFLQYIVRG